MDQAQMAQRLELAETVCREAVRQCYDRPASVPVSFLRAVANWRESDGKAERQAYSYLAELFRVCAPQSQPLPDLLGLCTQIDNLIAGYRIRLGELPD